LLLAHAAGMSAEQLIARGLDGVAPEVAARLRTLTARRVQREPMAYILGEREFWGLTFKVTPDVLVPRPDSETVIEAALAVLPDRIRAWRFLDLGVGSGCLLLALLKEFPNATGTGLDASQGALAVAQDNAEALGVASRTRLLAGDWRMPGWMEGLECPFDLVVSNPPYIEAGAIDGLMPEVARHEPRLALDGGDDGLAAYRIIAAAGSRLVTPAGYLLVEGGVGQAVEIASLFAETGMIPLAPWKDLGGIERVIPIRQ
jgi:release factor glutamine methyltransferase